MNSSPQDGSYHLQPAVVDAPALMPQNEADFSHIRNDHFAVHTGIIRAAQDLVRVTPDIFDIELTGIPLRGTIPLTLRGNVGSHYQHLSYTAAKNHDSDSDSYVSMWLHGNTPDFQVELATDDQSVEFGRNKLFGVKPYGAEKVLGQIGCDDVCAILDDAIPEPGRRFSALIDPRTDKSFDTIANSIGSILTDKATTANWKRGYTAQKQEIFFGKESVIDTEVNVILLTQMVRKRLSSILEVSSPVHTSEGRVDKTVRYGFITQPSKFKGQVQELFLPDAKFKLSSTEVPAIRLKGYMTDFQKDTDARTVLIEGIEILLSDKMAAYGK